MLARTNSCVQIGLGGTPIEIECDLSNGLPSFSIVGLGDKAIDEARDRVRSALKNSGLQMPAKRIVINLAPADIPKDGTGFDMGIAIAILIASGQIAQESTRDSVFLGEVALDGSLRPTAGVLSAVLHAQSTGKSSVFVPAANSQEAKLVTKTTVYPVETLRELYRHLIGEETIARLAPEPFSPARKAPEVDFSEIRGQHVAKRAVEIAVAGGHNVLLSGPPGAGKTMLARAAAGIMPAMNEEEVVEVTQLHSLAGLSSGIVTNRPFRNPHHTSSSIALVGGGRSPKPGEISLSHNGILFLDELPEFPRNVLEVLRQPLEDGRITIARAAGSLTLPARFTLIATQNPCPCGYFGDENGKCQCPMSQVVRYSRKISGPLLDRIDLIIPVEKVPTQELAAKQTSSEPSKDIALRIERARMIQKQRYQPLGISLNSQLQGPSLRQWCALDSTTAEIAKQAIAKFDLTGRTYSRVLKIARTIADLEESPQIAQKHFIEALTYRPRPA